MENIFRCSICKKEFRTEKDCLNDEINCLGLKAELNKMVESAKNILTEKYNVKFIEAKYNVSADSDNHGMDYYTYYFFNGKAEYKNKEFDFYLCNEQCSGTEYAFNSTDALVNNFVYRYLREKEIESNEIIGEVKLHEGHSIEEDSTNHYYQRYWSVGNQNIDELMYDLEGKNIKIIILK